MSYSDVLREFNQKDKEHIARSLDRWANTITRQLAKTTNEARREDLKDRRRVLKDAAAELFAWVEEMNPKERRKPASHLEANSALYLDSISPGLGPKHQRKAAKLLRSLRANQGQLSEEEWQQLTNLALKYTDGGRVP